MKIFTFYKPDDRFENQEKIIELWKLTWKLSGFEPIVLKESDAIIHPFYEEFVYKIKKLHSIVMAGKELSDYGLNCFIRWLAYSTQKDDFFYVSDYDLMSVGFSPEPITKNIHFMDDCCPCFVSGTPYLFNKLSISFVEETEKSLERFSKLDIHKKFSSYHDQDFIILHTDSIWNPDYEEYNKKYDIKKTRTLNTDCILSSSGIQKIIHFSHHYIERYLDNKGNKKNMGLTEHDRIEVIEEVLSNYFI